MTTTYTTRYKVFQYGSSRVEVFNNGSTVQLRLMIPELLRSPFIIIPKELCKEIGVELFELGK